MSRRTPPPAATLSGSPDDVEAEFYDALQGGDIERLMAVWADDDEIVCIHPGGPRVIGEAAIRASFEALFAHGGVPVRPEQVRRLQQAGSALHHLLERVDVQGEQGAQTAWVLATNLFVKTAKGWRLAAHHASPGLLQVPSTIAVDIDAPSTLH
ncbi:MAG: nuclear transport factor 2 family protein [Leptothrix sp. (in: b-proteobacteria)]